MKNNLYSLDGDVESMFFTGQLVNVKEHDIIDLKNWEKYLGVKDIKNGVIIFRNEDGELEKQKQFSREGIVYEFSKLKTDKEINHFANNYGLLGIGTPTSDSALAEETLRNRYSAESALFRIKNTSFFDLTNGTSQFEPTEVWKFHIDQIRKLLKLYKTLVAVHSGSLNSKEIESNIININDEITISNQKSYIVEWWDGLPTGLVISEEGALEGDFLDLARRVLIMIVNNQTSRQINNLAFNIVETNKPPLGFIVKESKSTPYLLNAIYYDLWTLISKNEPVHLCQNKNCRLPFKKRGRGKYCSNACKQQVYREPELLLKSE